jgi:hypothetical protein
MDKEIKIDNKSYNLIDSVCIDNKNYMAYEDEEKIYISQYIVENNQIKLLTITEKELERVKMEMNL